MRHWSERALPLATLLRMALWACVVACLALTTADPDLWGHVRFGLDVLHTGNLPIFDSYSFSSDRLWLNHEWAAEVVMAAAFSAGGNAGLILLKILVVAAIVVLLDVTLKNEGVHAVLARDGIAILTLSAAIAQMHDVRPQLFSLLAFGVLLSCLSAARRSDRRWLLLLPPLFALWANLHGGWMVGGAAVMLWTLGLALAGDRRQAAWCAIAGAVSLGATLVTPYGMALWRFLAATVQVERADIIEWQSVRALGGEMWILWSIPLGLTMFAVVRRGVARARPEAILLALMLAAASFQVIRLLAFFAMAVAFLLGPTIGLAYQRRLASARPAWRPVTRYGVALAAASVIAGAAVCAEWNIARLRIDRQATPEAAALAVLKARGGGARLLVWFDWGEYALWHLSPRLRVSIDGRRETVYSTALRERHLRFYFDAPGGAQLPEQLEADYIWLPPTVPAVRRLDADPRWQRIFSGDRSVIFDRVATDPPSLRLVAAATATNNLFPGP